MTMSANELDILHSHIDKSGHFLEFGAGASTLYAAGVASVRRIDSVESSEDFIEQNLKPNPIINEALSAGKLCFHVVDLGWTLVWGYPAGFGKTNAWPNYSFGVFTKASGHDLVLIDGRFRVACTLNCLLNTTPDCKIIIHDFWNRSDYHIVLPFLETKAKVDTLGLFAKKTNIDQSKVKALIAKYQYQPR
jgi:hypothetical protein